MEDQIKEPYVLLDWGGGIELEADFTAQEAKAANEELVEHEPRLLRWALKSVYGYNRNKHRV